MWEVALASRTEAWGTWQGKAACRGPESALFFPPSWTERRADRNEREEIAKAICASCGVRQACLDFAVRIHEQHGIWGGLNESERRRLAATAASGAETRRPAQQQTDRAATPEREVVSAGARRRVS